ncbi:ABC transporter ATP-binding protein [Solirhodobacter olei]|uniref:ABC transporter ATP-binding protein n=1 Tax=Solirhodobacter olei TaxID=2493082 RepID=UPI000FD8862D|nr:ABC transporter ATP-binding protein [Solirhodobacter olei]
MSARALEIRNARKSYGQTRAVADVSLDLAPGRILCLLGPSGSGKTSLLRLVAGLERLDGGEIAVSGALVDDAGPRFATPEQRALGMVFQDYALWPHLTAADNVGLPLRERRVPNWRAAGAAALAAVGLDRLGARYPHELSGGQQQRVSLARALAAQPRLLLFDEPLSNLDAKLRDELRDMIAATVRDAGIAALYITHDQSEAFFLGDQVGVLHNGNLLQIDAPDRVYDHPATPFVAHFTGAAGPFPVEVTDDALVWGSARAPRPVGQAPGKAQLFLRPQWLTPMDEGPGTLAGRVRVCGYAGGGWQALVDLPGGTIHLRLDRRIAAGERVAFHVDWARCLVFRED